MAGADGIEHPPHLGADRLLLLRRERVVAGIHHPGVGLDAQAGVAVGVVEDPALALGHALGAELGGGQLVAPVAEGALGELHDVALVHQGDVALVALQLQGVLDRLADVALAAVLAHRLDADARSLRDAALAELAVGRDHHLIEVLDQLEAHGVAGFPLDPHVDVLGVLAVHDHVQVLGPLVGAGGALVVAAGAHAAVQIEDLAQGHVQGADAAADRRGERTFDGHAVGADRFERVLGQILIGAVEVAGLVAGVHLEPLDAALAAIGLGHRRIEHLLGGGPDVHAGAIAADEGNDRIVGYHRLAVLEADRRARAGGRELGVGRGAGSHSCGRSVAPSLGFSDLRFCSGETA